MEGHTGDFWSQANSIMDVKAYKPEGNLDPVANFRQEYIPISMVSPYKNYVQRSGDFESPDDEWTTIEIYCFEGKSLHLVNGEVVMVLKNSRYYDNEGQEHPLIQGRIQIQNEAAEVFFKDIEIREINALKVEHEKLF